MRARAALDAIVFSSAWTGAAAVALTAAAARALGVEAPPAALALAFGGTLVVYTVDRLRDLERDRLTSPARSAFVARHRGALAAAVALAAAASGAAALALPARVAALCAAVLGVGLLHRRIKRVPGLKTAYVALAWTSVCVGVPALAAGTPPAPRRTAAVALALGLALAANVVVSNLRDGEGATARAPRRVALGFALALCAASAAACALRAGALPRAFAAVAVVEGAAIAGFASERAQRDAERYGLFVVDGALVAGGALAAALMR